MAGKRGFKRRRATQYTHKKQKHTMPHCGTHAQGSLKPLMVLKTMLLQLAAILSCLTVVSCHRDGALDLAICYAGGFQQAVTTPNTPFAVLIEAKSRSHGEGKYVGSFTKNQRKHYKGAGANDSIVFIVMDDIPGLQHAYPYGPEPTDAVCRELVLSPNTEVYVVPVSEIELGSSGAFTITPRLRKLYRVHMDLDHPANAPTPASPSPSSAGTPDSSHGFNATPTASPAATPTSSASPSADATKPSGMSILQAVEVLCHGRPWEVEDYAWPHCLSDMMEKQKATTHGHSLKAAMKMLAQSGFEVAPNPTHGGFGSYLIVGLPEVDGVADLEQGDYFNVRTSAPTRHSPQSVKITFQCETYADAGNDVTGEAPLQHRINIGADTSEIHLLFVPIISFTFNSMLPDEKKRANMSPDQELWLVLGQQQLNDARGTGNKTTGELPTTLNLFDSLDLTNYRTNYKGENKTEQAARFCNVLTDAYVDFHHHPEHAREQILIALGRLPGPRTPVGTSVYDSPHPTYTAATFTSKKKGPYGPECRTGTKAERDAAKTACHKKAWCKANLPSADELLAFNLPGTVPPFGTARTVAEAKKLAAAATPDADTTPTSTEPKKAKK